jgi:hypothetical protein
MHWLERSEAWTAKRKRPQRSGRTARPDGEYTVHRAKLTIRHKSVGTRGSGGVIRTHDPTLRIGGSPNHARFNLAIRSRADASRA